MESKYLKFKKKGKSAFNYNLPENNEKYALRIQNAIGIIKSPDFENIKAIEIRPKLKNCDLWTLVKFALYNKVNINLEEELDLAEKPKNLHLFYILLFLEEFKKLWHLIVRNVYIPRSTNLSKIDSLIVNQNA